MIDKNKRILVLTMEAFGGHGGIALYNRDLLSALCTFPGCSEIVAIPRYMSLPLEKTLPNKLTYMTKGLYGRLNYLITVLKIIRNNPQFDLIVCGHINLLPVAYLLHLWLHKPILLFIYGIDAWQPTKSLILNHLVSKVDHFVSISEITKNKFLEWTKLDVVKGTVLPNAIDMQRYGVGTKNTELLNRYGLNGKTVLMTLGRLAANERYKGFDEILDLLPDLILEIPNLIYLIVGDGTDRQRLEQKATLLNVKEHVVFAGFISDSEKAAHYRLADAYVMPGYGEGFGFVFLEAMACGIPVVASKLDGSREAVRDGKLGILVNPNDAEDIKQGILAALNQPKGIIPEGLEYFSYTNFEQRVHRLIDEVIGHK
jgi:glycosyltransferase involved in cell wall biosynthesis